MKVRLMRTKRIKCSGTATAVEETERSESDGGNTRV